MSFQIIFILNFFAVYFALKVSSALTSPYRRRFSLMEFFLLSPMMAMRSLASPKLSHDWRVIRRLVLSSLLCCFFWKIARYYQPLSYWQIILLSPLVYAITISLSAFAETLYYFIGSRTFPMHEHPLVSKSLTEFWGKRWNRWVQDWLKDVSYPFQKWPRYARILTTFFISALFHEALFNFPFWLWSGKCYFGTMIMYFMIQAIGLWVEKKYLKHSPTLLKRTYLWLVVLLPSPLFINQPLLTFLGLSHG